MPQTIIREQDNTTTGITWNLNNAVLIPGFIHSGTRENSTVSYGQYDDGTSIFDDNGIYVCRTQEDFKTYIGIVDPLRGGRIVETAPALSITWEKDEGEVTIPHYGNQMAYELLGQGYTVLFLNLGSDYNETAYSNLYAADENGTGIIANTKWEALQDKSIYQFRYVCSGLLTETVAASSLDEPSSINLSLINKINASITALAATRKDAIALLEINKAVYTTLVNKASPSAVVDAIENDAKNVKFGKDEFLADYGKYSAYFANSVKVEFATGYVYNNTELPAVLYYLACYAKSTRTNPSYYAIANVDRGTCNYVVKGTAIPVGEYIANMLQPRSKSSTMERSVNMIIRTGNVGVNEQYLIWGNRTAFPLDLDLRASHFLNIRQLLVDFQKSTYTICSKIKFDPNTDVLWYSFKNSVSAQLDTFVANGGITSNYEIIKVINSNKATLSAKVIISPLEGVEDITLDYILTDTVQITEE